MKRATRFGGSITSRAILLAIAPLIILSLALGIFLVANAFSSAEENLRHHGNMVAKSYARAAEYGLYVGDEGLLKSVISGALVDPDIFSIAVMNESGGTVVLSSRKGESTIPSAAEIIREKVFASPETGGDDAFGALEGIAKKSVPVLGEVVLVLSFARMEASQQLLLRNTVFYVLLGIALSVLLGGYLATSILGPLNRIIAVVEKLGRGEFASRVPESSSTELRNLESGINAMAEQIESSQSHLEAEVQSATSDLEATVEVLRVKNKELDFARVTAEKAGKAKAEFLALVSHELRTPLSGVIGFARLLEQQAENPLQLEYARVIDREGSQLLEVINDVLSISKLDSGQLEYEDEVFNPMDEIEATMGLFCHEAHKKSLELILMVHRDAPLLVHGDARRFSQVLANLVSNALKFTASGHVMLEVDMVESEKGHSLRVTILDTGIGIAADQQQEIFKPFAQGERAIDKHYGGTGLGLSISRMMMDQMHGEIGVLESFTVGARFFATLPAEGHDTQGGLDASELITFGLRVLLIESHPFQRRAVRNQLMGIGMEVTVKAEREMLNEPLELLRSLFDIIVIGLSKAEIREQQIVARLEAGVCADMPKLLLVGDEEMSREMASRFTTSHRTVTTKPLSRDKLLEKLTLLLDPQLARLMPLAFEKTDNRCFQKKALVGDDNDVNRKLMTIFLQQRGLEVDSVDGGAAVIEKLRQQVYDIVFIDLHMPDMDGAEACRRIRSESELALDIPIVAVTADISFGGEREKGASGFDEIIYKPFTDKTLVAVLEQWFTDTELTLPALPGNLLPAHSIDAGEIHSAIDKHIAALGDAVKNEDRAAIKDQSHQLLGVIGFFELHELKGHLQQISAASLEGSTEGLQQNLVALQQQYAQLLASDREAEQS